MKRTTRTKPTQTGNNRTGIASSPEEARRTQEGARQGLKNASTDLAKVQAVRGAYAKDAPPVGTLPKLKTSARKVPEIFIDQLASRIPFERAGARLYELLMVKLEAASPARNGSPTREDLVHLRDEELEHLGVTLRVLEELGADPTAMTPSADISMVNGSGILKNLADPRVTLTQALDSILIAELNDNETWAMLTTLALKLGRGDLAQKFRQVLEQEQDHLDKIRTWLNASIAAQAGLKIREHAHHQGAPSPQ